MHYVASRFPGRAILAAGLFALSMGCNGGEELTSTDPQATVSGTVTFEGKPITLDSKVVFFCKDKDATASGAVDSLGKYSLTSGRPALGIPAGRYQVMISPPSAPPPPVGSDDYKKAMMGKMAPPPAPKDIPTKFSSFETSKIVLEVKAGENVFDFDLSKL